MFSCFHNKGNWIQFKGTRGRVFVLCGKECWNSRLLYNCTWGSGGSTIARDVCERTYKLLVGQLTSIPVVSEWILGGMAHSEPADLQCKSTRWAISRVYHSLKCRRVFHRKQILMCLGSWVYADECIFYTSKKTGTLNIHILMNYNIA